MKTYATFLFTVLALCCSLRADNITPFFTYRGRVLTTRNKAPVADGTCTVRIRLYEGKTSEPALWGMTTTANVNNGFFQVPIGLERVGHYYTYPVTYENTAKLSDILREGKAHYIGVSINGGPEEYPRQQLMHALRANRALAARRISPHGSIGELETQVIKADSISLPKTEVRGTITAPVSTLRLEELRARSGKTVSVKNPFNTTSQRFQVFSSGDPEHLEFRDLQKGDVLKSTAKNSGIAVLISRDNLTVPCISFLVEEGAAILSPVNCTGKLDFYFYKFGTGR